MSRCAVHGKPFGLPASHSAIQVYPFETFYEPFSHSWQTVRIISKPFISTHSKFFLTHSPIHVNRSKYLITRSAVQWHPFQTAWWPVRDPFDSRAFNLFNGKPLVYVFRVRGHILLELIQNDISHLDRDCMVLLAVRFLREQPTIQDILENGKCFFCWLSIKKAFQTKEKLRNMGVLYFKNQNPSNFVTPNYSLGSQTQSAT